MNTNSETNDDATSCRSQYLTRPRPTGFLLHSPTAGRCVCR